MTPRSTTLYGTGASRPLVNLIAGAAMVLSGALALAISFANTFAL